jgi:hypothetical protein
VEHSIADLGCGLSRLENVPRGTSAPLDQEANVFGAGVFSVAQGKN